MTALGKDILKKIRKNYDYSHFNQEYKLFFSHFSVACIVCDSNGMIIKANDYLSNLTQCDMDKLEGKSIYEILQLELTNADSTCINKLTKGEIVTLELDLFANTKDIKGIEIIIIPVVKKQILIGMYAFLVDNTEKRELRKSLNQLKENVIYGQQLSAIGSWTHDIQKDEIFLSDQVYDILGCSPEEFDGKLENYYLYVHPDDIEEVRKATQGALEGKEYDIEYRIVTTNGTVKYVHEKTKVIYDEDKNPIKMIGIMQDITEHKLIENDLKAFGENLNQAQRVAGVGSWKYDAIEDKFYRSDEMYRIFGINPIDFKKGFNGLLELIHPEDKIILENAVDACLAGKAYQIEYRVPQNDGSEKFVRSNGEPLFGKNHQVVGILGTTQDITKNKLLEDQLKKSYKNLTAAQRLAQIGSWEFDIIHNKRYWSEETYRIYGITPDQNDGTNEGFFKFVHPDDIGMIRNISKDLPKEQPIAIEFRIIRPDGSVRNVYQLLEYVFDEHENPIYLYGTIQDITEKKELQKKLDQAQEEINKIQRRFHGLVQESSDVFQIISPDGTIIYISPAVEQILGYEPNEMTGKNILEFVEDKGKLRLTKLLQSVLSHSDKKINGEFSTKTIDGKDISLEVTVSNQLSEPSIQGIVMNWRDITERVKMGNEISYIATHDELTGLPNRVYFNKQILIQCEETKEKGNTFALMKFKIEELKYINDTLGYQSGDELIVQISQRLKNFLGDEGLIFRNSSTRFAIIVPGLRNIEEYESIAQGIIDLFLQPFKIGTYEFYATMNMGISIYPEDAQDPDSLLKYSNIALLQANAQGKNIYEFFSPNMDINNYKKFVLWNDLRKAIEKEQFKVYYQPQVNLKTNGILGAEALIRWEHPAWGMVAPDEFISLAEESGCIIEMGKWMLNEVCRNYKKWLNDGLPAIKVSINYSSIQFFEKDFVQNIKNIIHEFELNPDFLIIEITESILMNNTDKAISDINNLQALGIQVALDDFGMGFSSLSYLYKFNIDILKIDSSFIKNVPFDETSNVITKTVINIAKDLRIKLVAEGIETWDQLFYLQKLNCHTGQGFLYSKPVPEQDFIRIFAKKKCKPVRANDAITELREQRRRFFRVNFSQYLEADMTILEINGERTSIGSTKVVIKDIGIGGLCFISNLKLPIKRDIILKFTMQLMEKEIIVYGCPVWKDEVEGNLQEYGIEFTIEENERMALTGVLNKLQVNMRNNSGIVNGSFISESLYRYFSSDSNGV